MLKYRITPTSHFGFDHNSIIDINTGAAKAQYLSREFAEEVLKALELYDKAKELLFIQQPVVAPFKSPQSLNQQLFNSRYLVESSWIESMGYVGGTLRIYKADGGTITHLDVPEHVWRKLLNSDSVGQTYNKLIKGQYTSI